MRLLSIVLLAALSFIVSCNPDRDRVEIAGNAQGTTFSVIYYDDQHRDFSPQIDSILTAYDASVSTWVENSVISAINNNIPDASPDPVFAANFELAQKIARQTGGAFDVTVGPLVNAWGFGFKEGINIDQHNVDSILDFTGYEKIRIEGGRIVKDDPRIQVDFNAIAQGYSVDLLSRFLESKGIGSFLVEIGGEIYCRGLKPGERNWTVDIEKPDDSMSGERSSIVNLSVRDMAVATSGNYRKYYVRDGVKYSHTINPATGFPVRHSLLSATVVAPTCAEADAYATALMVMGVNISMKFLDNHPELECLLIYANEEGDMQIWKTDGMSAYISEE